MVKKNQPQPTLTIISRAAAVFLFGFLLAGCLRLKPPQLLGPELSHNETQEILQGLLRIKEGTQSLRALSRTSLSYRDQRQRVRQAFVFSKPDRLRVEFLPPNAAYTLALLVVRDGTAVYADRQARTVRREDSAYKLIYSTLRIPAESEDLMSYLVGQIPQRFLQGSNLPRLFKTEDPHVLQFVSARGEFRARLGIDNLLLHNFELRDQFNEHLIAQVSYRDYAPSDATFLPGAVLMNMVRDGAVVELHFSSASLNDKVSDSLFELAVPTDFMVEEG